VFEIFGHSLSEFMPINRLAVFTDNDLAIAFNSYFSSQGRKAFLAEELSVISQAELISHGKAFCLSHLLWGKSSLLEEQRDFILNFGFSVSLKTAIAMRKRLFPFRTQKLSS